MERDRELVPRFQDGDPAAFAELYTRYAARLHRYRLRGLHDSQEAEDVTQEAFVEAWRALPGFAGELVNRALGGSNVRHHPSGELHPSGERRNS
ncbi:MAG: sigma factor [Acidimicrobiales bacterium]